MHKSGVLLATSAVATIALSSTALAGGFQRGTADTDILFERGTFSMRTGLTHVSPQRGFETIEGRSSNYGEYTDSYTIPSFAVAFGTDPFACAGTYTESFGAEADYSGATDGELPPNGLARITGSGFESDEFSATCRASLDTSSGRFSFLGGVVFEDYQAFGSSNSQINLVDRGAFGALTPLARTFGIDATIDSRVDVEASSGFDTGYRIGAAYEIPEMAMRIQGMYRSEIEHEAFGTANIAASSGVGLTANGMPVTVQDIAQNPVVVFLGQSQAVLAAGARLPQEGSPLGTADYSVAFTTPQSLMVTAQTGIAPGTLILGSFRWTDWSINESIDSNVGGSVTSNPYNWRDGYTASIGVGRAFNERISGAVALGYDRGVSTGAETTYTDLYTVTAGLAFRPDTWGEIRVGGLVGYWTDGEQSTGDGAYFDATVGDDIVVGGNAAIKFTF